MGRFFRTDGKYLGRAYKEHLSGFGHWEQKRHAHEWMLLEKNMGERLSIDETALQHDLFTFLSNKDGHGRKGTLVAAVKGTTVADVTRHLEKTAILLHETDQQGVLSFSKNPVWLHKNMAVWHGAQQRGKTSPNCP